jgi:hypothetical protein
MNSLIDQYLVHMHGIQYGSTMVLIDKYIYKIILSITTIAKPFGIPLWANISYVLDIDRLNNQWMA